MVASTDNLGTLQRLSYLRAQATHRELSEAEQDELSEEPQCIHCGGFHVRACPRVKRIAFHPQSAKIVEVEYWPSDQVDWTGVVFTDTADEEEQDSETISLELINDLEQVLMVADGSLERKGTERTFRRVSAWLDTVRPRGQV